MANKKNLKDYVEEIEPAIQKAVEAVEPQIKKAKEAVEPQIKKARKAVEPQIKKAKEAVEPQIKKAKEAVEPHIQNARKKAEPVVKEAVNRVAKVATKTDLFIQFDGVEIRTDDIVDKVREDYKNRTDGSTEEKPLLKQLRIYIKPDERCAYYVANQDETGKVEL